MTSYANIIGDSTCECADPGCPAHKGVSDCAAKTACVLFRVDMDDETGTAMCEACAEDALKYDVFTR